LEGIGNTGDPRTRSLYGHHKGAIRNKGNSGCEVGQRIGSCLKFVRVAPLTLRLRLRYAQDEWGRVCIGTDSVHEPKNSGLCGAHLAFLQRMKHATSLTRSLRVGWNYLWIIV